MKGLILENGTPVLFVDEEMRRRLETKLIFYSQCQLCYPLYARWYRQLPAFSGAYVCACRNRHGTRQNLTKIV